MKDAVATQKMYEGKAKVIFLTKDENYLIQEFKNDITAFNGVKKDSLQNKGLINNYISEYFMGLLAQSDISTHFVKRISDTAQLIKRVDIIPLEVIVRNRAAGSFVKRFGVEKGMKFYRPCVEFSLKDDSLGDPAISEDQIECMNILSYNDILHVKSIALRVNEVLQKEFDKSNLELIDFKIEVGYLCGSRRKEDILVADEISPDSCRIWDKEGNSLDKDIYRNNLGDAMAGYLKIANILGIKIPL